MAKTKQEKQKIVQDYIKDLEGSKGGTFIIETQGVKANEISKLKKDLANLKAQYRVVKNTLFSIALQSTKTNIKEKLQGSVAVLFTAEEPTAPLKELKKVADETGKITFKEGILDGRNLGSTEVQQLAELPPKEELIASVIQRIGSPIYGFVNTLNQIPSSLVLTLKAIQEKKS